MRITEEEFKRAGELEEGIALGILKEKFAHSNDELRLMIKAKRLTIAYLEGRGARWQLALGPLRHELERLEGFSEARKRDRS